MNAGHAGDLLVCSCYETVKVYHVTRVFGVKLGRRHAGVLRLFRCESVRGGA
nr:MAG TPA: hypothetical protein [Caudoviricetes sp.]